MGRTVPSFRMVLETEIAKWRGFLRALLGNRDKEAFEAFYFIGYICEHNFDLFLVA